MSPEQLAQSICDYLKTLDDYDSPYVDDSKLEFVCVDGWFNMIELAEHIIKQQGEEQ